MNPLRRLVRSPRLVRAACATARRLPLGADAWGLDIVERGAWQALADERTHYVLGDLTAARLFDEDMCDRIISFAVWEHIAHPTAALAETFRVLRPGGLAWIKANLQRGPMASHLYRDISFPYPHLCSAMP